MREIVVFRYDNRIVPDSFIPNSRVRRVRQPSPTDMIGFMPSVYQPARQRWRQLRVHQEFQLRHAQYDVIRGARGVFERGRDIAGLKVGIVGEYLFVRRAGGQQIQNVFHTYA
jgi:hypothetical protein